MFALCSNYYNYSKKWTAFLHDDFLYAVNDMFINSVSYQGSMPSKMTRMTDFHSKDGQFSVYL